VPDNCKVNDRLNVAQGNDIIGDGSVVVVVEVVAEENDWNEPTLCLLTFRVQGPKRVQH
jgi:hypothetical protein